MVGKKSMKEKIADAIIYFCLSVLGILTLLPVVNILALSFSDSVKASSGLVTVYPLGFNVEPYKMILKDKALLTAVGVSLKRCSISLVLGLFLTVMVSYPLSKGKRQFPLRNFYMWFILITMMFPPNIVPLYLTVRGLDLIGSIWALVLPGAVGQFFIILVVNYFRSLPKSLDESASIDGASPWRRLFQIYIPLSKPIIATIALFSLVYSWNAYLDGLIYSIRTEDYPLQTYIQQLVVTINPGTMNVEDIKRTLAVSSRNLSAAKIVVTMLPIMVVYPFLQRYFISGIMLGAVKE